MAYLISAAAKKRRQFYESFCQPFGNILEIGAFDNAVFHRDFGDEVKYVDWFTKDELARIHGNTPNRRMDQLVDVDFPIKRHDWANEIAERFMLISASHVIEHIADVIFWLNQIALLLADNGFVFLAVPDKRYTFDFYREPSQAIEMVRDSRAGLTMPSTWQVVQHFYYHTKVDVTALWSGEPPPIFKPRYPLKDAFSRAEALVNQYVDVHCWVFTPDSFARAVSELHADGIIDLKVIHIEPTRHGSNEFWAILIRP